MQNRLLHLGSLSQGDAEPCLHKQRVRESFTAFGHLRAIYLLWSTLRLHSAVAVQQDTTEAHGEQLHRHRVSTCIIRAYCISCTIHSSTWLATAVFSWFNICGVLGSKPCSYWRDSSVYGWQRRGAEGDGSIRTISCDFVVVWSTWASPLFFTFASHQSSIIIHSPGQDKYCLYNTAMFHKFLRHTQGPTCGILNFRNCRAFSFVSKHQTFPASLYRFQIHRDSKLFDRAFDQDDWEYDDGVEISADGLVHPNITDACMWEQIHVHHLLTYLVSNGAILMPNTHLMQELTRRSYDQYLDNVESLQAAAEPHYLCILKGDWTPFL